MGASLAKMLEKRSAFLLGLLEPKGSRTRNDSILLHVMSVVWHSFCTLLVLTPSKLLTEETIMKLWKVGYSLSILQMQWQQER